MSVNIKELARQLNLAVSTVSKALHDSYEISDKTKKLVVETAARLNYTPHPYASGLRARVSKNIAVVIPEVADSFFAQAINGIESVAKQNGYHVLIYLSHERLEKEKEVLKECQCGRVDGVLLSVSRETDHTGHIRELMDNGVPLVLFDRVCEDIATTKIITDDFKSGYNAAMHLIRNGCRKIVFLNNSATLLISNKRKEGFLQAHQDSGLNVRKWQLMLCSDDAEKNIEAIRRVIRKNKPDGVLAAVEKLTLPVYQACAGLQLNIPQDIKVIYFSNLETASILSPSLTTITQPSFEMGEAAAGALITFLAKKNGRLADHSITIESVLEERSSTLRFV